MLRGRVSELSRKIAMKWIEMESSIAERNAEKREETETPLCLIESDNWAPLLNRSIHLNAAHEDRCFDPSSGARRTGAYASNRLLPPQ